MYIVYRVQVSNIEYNHWWYGQNFRQSRRGTGLAQPQLRSEDRFRPILKEKERAGCRDHLKLDWRLSLFALLLFRLRRTALGLRLRDLVSDVGVVLHHRRRAERHAAAAAALGEAVADVPVWFRGVEVAIVTRSFAFRRSLRWLSATTITDNDFPAVFKRN